MLLNYDINALRVRTFITVMQKHIIITETPEKPIFKIQKPQLELYIKVLVLNIT